MSYAAIRPYATNGADALGLLHPDGKIFRYAEGTPWRWRGVSAFQLLDRFARGLDIAPFVMAYPRYNTLRVWPYVPAKDWGDRAWDSPAPAVVVDFLEACARLAYRVELTLLTDDDGARIQPAIELVRVLIGVRPSNLFLEAGNEPLTHKQTNVKALKPILDEAAAVGIPYSSGVYEDEFQVFGTVGTHHSARTSDWPRRAHDAMEFYDGAGPHQPHPPIHTPWVLDEPIRPDEAPGDRAQKIRDFRAYGGTSALLGAGATFHSTSGKFAELPTAEETDCANALADGLEAFPADAPLGPYRRIVEPNQPEDARTYVVEPYAVRCQQIGAAMWEPGWKALDADGILWTR